MVKIVKTGNSYTITEVGENSNASYLSNFVGVWSGSDMWGPTQIETSLVDGVLQITGVGVKFMEDGWGEEILDMQTLPLNVNICTGEFSISESYYMETLYGGAVQDKYYLSGTGTLDLDTLTMDLQYDFVQGGTSYVDWLTPYGYVFHEIVTLN